MTTLDDLISRKTDSFHPQVRKWKARLDEPNTSATLDVYQPQTEIGQPQAAMILQFTKDGKPLPEETLPWDDDVNAGLIQVGVRAVRQGDEAIRFKLGLRAAMRKASREFGDGYFNAVLIDFLSEIVSSLHSDIAQMLKDIQIIPPHQLDKTSERYTTCRELIEDAISDRGRELTELLHYTPDVAKNILVFAITRYLDERFSVSYRRNLGLL